MNSLERYRMVDLWVGLLDMQSEHKTSPFTEKVLSGIIFLKVKEVFLLARKYMIPSRPQATKMLSDVISVDLVFCDITTIERTLMEKKNPEAMERLLLFELMYKGSVSTENLPRLVSSISGESLRFALLSWLVNQDNLSLLDLVLLRRSVAFSYDKYDEKAIENELAVIDEKIKTFLISCPEESVVSVLRSIRAGHVAASELPLFFLPMVWHLFPYL